MAEAPQRISWPPRLIGAAFHGLRPFGGSAYLAIDSLTVLLGANGAGKTTTLRLLETHLPQLASRPPADEDDLTDTRCSFFVEVSHEQLDILMDEAVEQLPASPSSATPLWLATPHDVGRDAGGMHAGMSRLIGVHGKPSEEVAAALKASRILRVTGDPAAGFNIEWCIAPEAAEGVGLPQPTETPGTPVTVAALGMTNRTMLPTAVAVPRELDELRLELREAVLDILDHLRWAERDRWARERAVPIEDMSGRRGTQAWLRDPESEVAAVEPDARALCGLVSRLATALAPSFVSDVHRVVVSVEPIREWERGGPFLQLELERADGIRYLMRRAADGHKVWLQLALLEAITVLRRYLAVLEALLEKPGQVREVASGEARSAWRRYDAAIDLLRTFGRPKAQPALDQFLALRNVGHRLYMIDEPEQHLHPRLQRAAARWLVEAGTAGASQCLVVTHSPHYLRIPGRVAFAYVQQEPDSDGSAKSVIRVLTPELLAATDEIANEMGFDRGELLSAVSTILFVEGQADKLFLEGYAGSRFHHAGIALIPIHGAVAAERKGVVDSEIVLNWTAARLAVLLDNLLEPEWQRLVADDDYRHQQSRKPSKTELKAMADILNRSVQVGRAITPVGIPVDDIFDLLDEDLLKRRFTAFPGHAEARSAHAAATAKSAINWKAFYRTQYGIEVEPELFGELGEQMGRQQSSSQELEELVSALIRLAEAS